MPDKKAKPGKFGSSTDADWGVVKRASGMSLQIWYEIQGLDSSGLKIPGTGDCGALDNQAAPLVNACKPSLSWQTYDPK
jgi:hypothetical protein